MQTPKKTSVRVTRLKDVATHLRLLAGAVDHLELLWEEWTPDSKQRSLREVDKTAVAIGNESGRLKSFRKKAAQRKVQAQT